MSAQQRHRLKPGVCDAGRAEPRRHCGTLRNLSGSLVGCRARRRQPCRCRTGRRPIRDAAAGAFCGRGIRAADRMRRYREPG
jgi:hypothetical protein